MFSHGAWFLVGGIFLQSIVLLLKSVNWRIRFSAIVSSVTLLGSIFFFLRDRSLYSVCATGMVGVALLLLRSLFCTTEVSEQRKPEMVWFLLAKVFLGAAAIQSESYLYTLLLIAALLSLTIVSLGVPFRNRQESESMNKALFHWVLYVISAVAGLCLAIAYGVGYDYSAIRGLAFSQDLTLINRSMISLFLFLPIWVASGIFPFHFFTIDRDSGASWSQQGIASILVGGLINLVVLIFSHRVLYSPEAIAPHPIIKLLMVAACASALWAALGALTQTALQRQLAFIVAAVFPAVLIPALQPSTTSLASASFGFVVVAIGLGLLFGALRAVSESSQQNTIAGVGGLGRALPQRGVEFLGGAAILMALPPFAGFSWRLQALAALFEQKNFFPLVLYCGAALLLAAAVLRLAVVFFFADVTAPVVPAWKSSKKNGPDIFLLVVALSVILWFGLYADGIRLYLLEAAKPFVIF